MKKIFSKILSLLRVRSVAGGLEVSDQVLRLVYFNGKLWELAAVRLAPGVMEKGKIKDAEAFIKALSELKAKIPFSRSRHKKMNVVVALSSAKMYMQVFPLPVMEGKNLADAVDLNLKMLSPIDTADAYFGWEPIGKDDSGLHTEIAAAFIERTLIDEMTKALYAAGFIIVGVESRALALARIFQEKGAGADLTKAYLLLDIDNTGTDFLVIRKGRLYFEYPTEWGDLGDEKGEVSIEKFKRALAADLRQVVNFAGQHWPSEPLVAVVLSSTILDKEASDAIAGASSLPVIRLSLEMGQPISSEWLVALGCSLRGMGTNLGDAEINLSGPEAIDMFHDEQLTNFMVLWRVLVPAVLALIIVALAMADNFLMNTKTALQAQSVSVSQKEAAQIAALTASSTAFNEEVALAANAEGRVSGDYQLISDLTNLAAANGITVNKISFPGQGSPIFFSGSSLSETGIVSFKMAVQNDNHFGAANLPLTNIQQGTNGYTFSMTFPLNRPFFNSSPSLNP